MVVQVSWDGVTGSHRRETVRSQFDSALGESLPKPEFADIAQLGRATPLQGEGCGFKSPCRYQELKNIGCNPSTAEVLVRALTSRNENKN